MDLMISIIVCFIAGAGAGLGTGFAGLSAAAVISPMLITFLDVPAYAAIGIALASDVLASAVSAYIYGKNKNIDIKNGLVMLVFVLIFTFLGSLIGKVIPNDSMGGFSLIMTLLLGIRFIVKPTLKERKDLSGMSKMQQILRSGLSGSAIGLVCGTVGAGGGMMMLLVLTSILGYELKTAVGTSVFVMTFTALTGAVSHFALGGMPDILLLVLCVVFTLLWARIGAALANKASAKTLNRTVGVILTVLGVGMIAVKYLF